MVWSAGDRYVYLCMMLVFQIFVSIWAYTYIASVQSNYYSSICDRNGLHQMTDVHDICAFWSILDEFYIGTKSTNLLRVDYLYAD